MVRMSSSRSVSAARAESTAAGVRLQAHELDELPPSEPREVHRRLDAPAEVDDELSHRFLDASRSQRPEERHLAGAARWAARAVVDGDHLAQPRRPPPALASVVLQVALALLRRGEVAPPRAGERLLRHDRRDVHGRLEQGLLDGRDRDAVDDRCRLDPPRAMHDRTGRRRPLVERHVELHRRARDPVEAPEHEPGSSGDHRAVAGRVVGGGQLLHPRERPDADEVDAGVDDLPLPPEDPVLDELVGPARSEHRRPRQQPVVPGGDVVQSEVELMHCPSVSHGCDTNGPASVLCT